MCERLEIWSNTVEIAVPATGYDIMMTKTLYSTHCSGIDTGGSGGSMNLGPRGPGGPQRRTTKNFMQGNN